MPGIDIHTHAFHPKIADKVCAQLQAHYGIQPTGSGLVEDLLARLRRADLDRAVVLCAATAPAQVIPANNWVMALQREHPQVVAFGTLHPDYADWEAELERLYAAGIRGLKFHPEFQGFRMDAPALKPIMEAAQERFAFLFHVGDRLPPQDNPSCPYKLAALLRDFPKARILAAHMGGYLHWGAALEVLAGRRVYFDTSSTLPFIPEQQLRELWRRHPRELILFGSDYPLYDPGQELQRLQQRLHLRDSELEALPGQAEAFLAG